MRGILPTMKAIDVAIVLGVAVPDAERYLSECEDVVETEQCVAVLRKGAVVHLAIQMRGLGGRKLLRDCRAILARWFDIYPVLFAPVKHGNEKAIAIATALGFRRYADTVTHVWLRQTREIFNGQ